MTSRYLDLTPLDLFCFALLAYLLPGFYFKLGGTAIYVSSAVLFVITAYAFKLGKYQKLCAVLNMLMSACYISARLIYFSPYMQFFIFLPALFFVVLAFARLSKTRRLSKVLILISLLIWSGVYFTQLEQLKAYYQTQHTGESWQQYGAL